MIEISIPGFADLRLEHLVLDYNGTLARDGKLLPGVRECLVELAEQLQVYVVTADTFAKAQAGLAGCPCELVVLPKDDQAAAKLAYIERLGSRATACIGNGRNDRLMVERAALGIACIQEEGAAQQTLTAADVVCNDVVLALKLLTNPLRLTATLRS